MTPPLPPAETSAVFALIALISDPQACNQRLGELKAMGDDITARYEKLVAESGEFERAKASFEKDTAAHRFELQEAERQLEAAKADHAKRVAEVGAREAKVGGQMIAAEEKEKDLAARQDHVDQRERFVQQHENAIAARMAALDQRELDLEHKHVDLNDRLQKLKALAG